MTSNGTWVNLGKFNFNLSQKNKSKLKKLIYPGAKPDKVKVEIVDCSVLSVDIFDRFYEKNIVRENGNIKKCLDEYCDDILISDELRKVA